MFTTARFGTYLSQRAQGDKKNTAQQRLETVKALREDIRAATDAAKGREAQLQQLQAEYEALAKDTGPLSLR